MRLSALLPRFLPKEVYSITPKRKMIIQEQRWHNHTLMLFADEKGSAQLELFDKPQFGSLQITAFIFNLWTVPEYRHQGHARELLEIVEKAAAERGHSAVFLDWDSENCSREIRDWYIRNGYVEVGLNSKGNFSRLRKKLSIN